MKLVAYQSKKIGAPGSIIPPATSAGLVALFFLVVLGADQAAGAEAQQGAARMVATVRSAVDVFTAGAEQYDDITMVGFRRTREAS